MPAEQPTSPTAPLALPAVQLVAPTEADVDQIAGWSQDPVWCAAAEWAPSSLAACRAHLINLVHNPPPELIRLIVRAEDSPVGYVDLHGTDESSRELGYVIGPRSRWGQGLATAAATAAVAFGFSQLALSRVWAECWESNPASQRVLAKVGFTQTGFGETGSYLSEPTRYVQWELTKAAYDAVPRKYANTANTRRFSDSS